MDNDANKMYGALPERFFIIKNGKIAFEGGKGPENYNISKMEESLKKLVKEGKEEVTRTGGVNQIVPALVEIQEER